MKEFEQKMGGLVVTEFVEGEKIGANPLKKGK